VRYVIFVLRHRKRVTTQQGIIRQTGDIRVTTGNDMSDTWRHSRNDGKRHVRCMTSVTLIPETHHINREQLVGRVTSVTKLETTCQTRDICDAKNATVMPGSSTGNYMSGARHSRPGIRKLYATCVVFLTLRPGMVRHWHRPSLTRQTQSQGMTRYTRDTRIATTGSDISDTRDFLDAATGNNTTDAWHLW